MKKSKRLISILIWTAALLACLILIQAVLIPKYVSVAPEGSLTAEYYTDVSEVSHDLLFVGDCEVYETFIPAVLWEEYGVSSYVRGGPQQLPWQSYYMLEEALRYETPKVVVFNVLALKYGEPQNDLLNHQTIDGMRWSTSKVKCILASMTEDETFASYLLPLLRFHDRWWRQDDFLKLTEEDWTYMWGDKPLVSDSGYLLQTGVEPVPEVQVDPLAPDDYTLPKTAMDYLDRMRTLCEEKGITFVLVKAPTNAPVYHWWDEWDAQITVYAEEHDLDYYNLIPNQDEIGLDWQTDTYDAGEHLNVYGAEKTTRYFGKILCDNYDLPDRRLEEGFSTIWNQRVQTFYNKWKQTEEGTI